MKISLDDGSDNQSKKEMYDSLGTTGTSIAFRSIGRQKKPTWGNRFFKDFNDLTYDVKYDLLKNKSNFNVKQYNNFKKNQKLTDINQHKKFRSKQTISNDYKINELKKRSQTISISKKPQIIQIRNQYSTISTAGLCKFQFEKTISGRLKYKSNLHLAFQNQTQRNINQNKVWYNPQKILDFQSNQLKKKRDRKDRMHSFRSYTKRVVFKPKDDLDKFYDTKDGFRVCSAYSNKDLVAMGRLTQRKPLQKKQGTQLSYNQYDADKKFRPKSCSYTISKSLRQIKFSRQVISPSRGCYR